MNQYEDFFCTLDFNYEALSYNFLELNLIACSSELGRGAMTQMEEFLIAVTGSAQLVRTH